MAIFRWTAPDTLDLEIAVKPQQAMPSFELFVSSYFAQSFRASIYLQGVGGKPASFVFGRDLAAGETARARCRLIVRRHLTNDDAVRSYQEYVGQPTRG